MIDGLIAGRLYGKPTERRGQSDKAFVVAKIRVATVDGESLFVNAIVFSDSAKAALLTLDDGDSVSLSGTLTPKVWTDKNGEVKPALDMTAHAVLTAYHVKRKRDALAQPSSPKSGGEERPFATGKRNGTRAFHGDSSSTSLADDDLDF
ncbi:single-stranded DNA-binding protein [Trinickia dabaoshanensis]|uniref:Single-stranded DNA-binding protein n=1 Tax=Trinickia dabaoshanensis TaxID=564714 RepID=A0A2N7VL26_9BURK|nr:single-stranded DNA-binding protein [Trinickia dabaoshanensis]PMS17843.1 single-stranded DNA-binding protein [Trinickia dabaoshanensis]